MKLLCQSSLARALVAASALALASVHAATIPAGAALSPKQEMVRNNGAEPESLDPAYIESVNGAEIERDLFEGLTSTNHHGDVEIGRAHV